MGLESWLTKPETERSQTDATEMRLEAAGIDEARVIFDHVSISEEVRAEMPDCPARFAEEVLGLWLSAKQREVLEAVRDHEKVVVPSCHAAGKTFLSGIVVLWWLFTRKPAYVITTAPTWRQVKRLLWKEIRALFRRLPEGVRGQAECDMTQLKMLDEEGEPDPYHYAYGFATENPDDMPGEHAENMLVVYDEAPGITDEQFGVMDTYQPDRELMIGNPVNPEGRFRRAVEKAELGWRCVKISAYDTPNFTGEEVPENVSRQLLRPDRVEQWKVEWGEDSAYFRARVLAEFPDSDATTVIAPMMWVEAAIDREAEKLQWPTAQVGVDVARSGSNRTAIAVRLGGELLKLESLEGNLRTQETAYHAAEAAQDLYSLCGRTVEVLIDETGVGAGVVDLLYPCSDSRIRYHGVLFGGRANSAGRFINWRAEAYWTLREVLRPGSPVPKLSIGCEGPEIARFRAQISSIRYEMKPYRIKIESKEDMEKRGLPSPDEADAVVLAVGPLPPTVEQDDELVTMDELVPEFQAIEAGATRLPLLGEPW